MKDRKDRNRGGGEEDEALVTVKPASDHSASEDHFFDDPEGLENFQKALLGWYDKEQRTLPWREPSVSKNKAAGRGYAVWVSEIMLQQTKVETVKSYYRKWMEKFPSVQALAKATPDEVNSIWAGLGYYSRARNLHKAAELLVDQYHGELPEGSEELKKLPGIGPYTAGAISSIAFGQPSTLVDGNVIRVFARLCQKALPRDDKNLHAFSWEVAGKVLHHKHPGNWNQALMELGALVCTPSNPTCHKCPVSTHCKAFADDPCKVATYPAPKAKKVIPEETYKVLVFVRKLSQEDGSKVKQFLVCKRPSKGLLANQLEFLMIRIDSEQPKKRKRSGDSMDQPSSQQVRRLACHVLREKLRFCNSCSTDLLSKKAKRIGWRKDSGHYTHVFTHLKHKLMIETILLASTAPTECSTCDLDPKIVFWKTESEMNQVGVSKSAKVCLQRAKATLKAKAKVATFFKQG